MNFQNVLLASFLVVATAVSPTASIPVPAVVSSSSDSWEDIAVQLELAPEDPKLLEACGLAALEEGEKDIGLWYLVLASEAAPTDKGLQKRIQKVMEANEHPFAEGGRLLETYTQDLFNLSNVCTAKQLYANSVELLGRCAGTRFEEAAQQRLDKIFKKKKAVDALLSSGISVPVNPKRKKSAKKVAQLNKKYSEWEKPHVMKGKNYTIKTNMGYNLAEDMLSAMEQINKFYRQAFNYKKRGGGMRSCTIKVFKSRQEFDKHTGVESSVLGFFSPMDNDVTTYDHRADPNRPGTMAELWSTLFHEASHQFTHAVWPNPIPTWLNEGTASYFEGTRIDPGGKVVFNLVPEGRLRNLVFFIGAGSPTVREVITHFEGGSYEGSYYPFGWGLIYFLRNYEDEKSNRVYLPILEEFMDSYSSGGNHSVKGRFVEYFVEKANQPDVTNFKEFVTKWEAWILELARVHNGGAEVADELIERGDRQLEHGFQETALVSYQEALRKRPGDSGVMETMAKLFMEMKKKDAALYLYRQLADQGRMLAQEDPELSVELLAMAEKGITKIDGTIAKKLAGADTKFVESTLKLAEKCGEAGLQRSALQYLKQANDVIGGDERLTTASDELAAELDGDFDVRRTRRVPTDKEMEHWEGSGSWTGAGDGLDVKAKGMRLAFCRWDLPATYRYEASIDISSRGKGGMYYGLTFASKDGTKMRVFGVAPDLGKSGIIEFTDGKPKFTSNIDDIEDYREPGATMAIEVSPGHIDFFYNEEEIGSMDVDEQWLGQVGLMVQGAEATWTDIRLKY